VPELPEVEVVRQGVERFVAGRTIETAEVLHPRAVRRHTAGPADLEARLAGRPVTGARRRGKYLWLPLDHDEALLAHLGMSGQLIVGEPDRPYGKHLRARLTFTDGGFDLRFTDQRTFGHLMLTGLVSDAREASAHGENPARGRRSEGDVPEPIAHIAPDPLEDAFDDGAFYRELRHRHTGIKRALLNQSLISGVGNIYADEALWRARLHWARPTETLTRAEVERVLAGVREVMVAALKAGGTSFDHLYVNVNGESGYFDRLLNVYGRGDEPCERCGTPIRRDAFMNRSSYTCPRCQPRPRRARY
jgi:formamidopyrimidine-DNA glycosylase